MGSSVTIVTAIAALAPGYTVYCPPNQAMYPFYISAPLYVVCTQQPGLVNGGNFTYTGIIAGSMFGFLFQGAVQDGDIDQIYNITSGQSGNAIATCNTTTTTNTCSTPINFVLTGNYYELETFASSERNYTNGQQDSGYNYSIIVLPPVPAQPMAVIQYSGSNNVSTGNLVVTTSQYSSEYGSAMTGCLLHYGKTPYQPSNIPTTLTSSTSVPSNATTYFNLAQNKSMTVSLASLNNAPPAQVGYDYHWSCYNGNGQSPEVILYNVSYQQQNSATSRYGTRVLSTLLGLSGVLMAAVTLLA